MLEQLLIFTRGGLILWTYRELGSALKGSPIDSLIRSCLLEERSGEPLYNYDAPRAGCSYTLKWTFHNELRLVFVAVYQRILNLLYVDDLLSSVKREFSVIYSPKKMKYADFDDTFRQLIKEAEMRSKEMQGSKQAGAPIIHQKKKGLKGVSGSGGAQSARQKQSSGNGNDGDDLVKENGTTTIDKMKTKPKMATGKGIDSNTGAFDVNKLQKMRGRGVKKVDVTNKDSKVDPKRKETKKNRVWEETRTSEKLDFSNPAEERENEAVAIADEGDSLMDRDDDDEGDEEVSESGEVEGETNDKEQQESTTKKEKKNKGWFSSVFQSIAGKSQLEKDDLAPAVRALKDRLMMKNVAEEIAEKLCESVAASLEGKKLASFTRISSTVQEAMEEAVVRILTPKRSIDMLREAEAARDRGRPYVVVFVGVNGVGKSTNLAKVAYWLMQHGLGVTMAACDTFRSGAVEQLRTHARRLGVAVFERGYEKDPSAVALEAVREARRRGSDVVLVDTAGRMQDNDPLMRALSKLIRLNRPDLVLFVGEALVGNDAVDQLTKFNQRLADLSGSDDDGAPPHLIDAILLTKFDTIDDKVGAALSMVYVSGSPIVFVGCGQSYSDLKKLNAKSVARTLLH